MAFVLHPLQGTSLAFILLTMVVPSPIVAVEATVIGMRRGGDGPALLLRVPDGAEIAVPDLASLLDAAGNGSSDSQMMREIAGRRYGALAVAALPTSRAEKPRQARAAEQVAKPRVVKPKPVARPVGPVRKPAPPEVKPVKPAKPDITIFEPETLKADGNSKRPPAKGGTSEAKPSSTDKP